MAPKHHSHNYNPYKRINRILVYKCNCGQTRTELIVHFTKEKAQEIDDLLKALNRNEDE